MPSFRRPRAHHHAPRRTPRRTAAVLACSALSLVLGAGAPTAATAADARAVPAAQAVVAPTSGWSVSMYADDDSWSGENVAWSPADGDLQVAWEDDVLVLTATDPSHAGRLEFAAPRGESLTVGSYRDAEEAYFRFGHHPGAALALDHLACGRVAGDFVVHELAPDLSRVRITYDLSCEAYAGRVFGDVVVGGPAGGALTAAPHLVSWPTQDPGTLAAVVPVRLDNTGPAPATVALAVRGEDFAADARGCGLLAPGEGCIVEVSFRPVAVGPRSGELVASVAGDQVVLPLRGTGRAGVTGLRVDTAAGSTVVTPADATFVARGSSSTVSVSAQRGDDVWSVVLVAPAGELVLPGRTFTGLRELVAPLRFPRVSTRVPAIEGCMPEGGRVTVHEARYSPRDELEAVSMTLSQRCAHNGPVGMFQATFSWQASGAAPDPDPVVPWESDPVRDLRAHATIGSASLTWTPPEALGRVGSGMEGTVRVREDGPPPEAPGEGRGFEALDDHARLDGLRPGHDYGVSVFALPRVGPTPPPASVTLRGTELRVSLARRPAKVLRDGGVTAQRVRGRLVAVDGRSVGRRPLVLEVVRRSGGVEEIAVRTTPSGRFERSVRGAAAVRVVFGGQRLLLGSVTRVRPTDGEGRR